MQLLLGMLTTLLTARRAMAAVAGSAPPPRIFTLLPATSDGAEASSEPLSAFPDAEFPGTEAPRRRSPTRCCRHALSVKWPIRRAAADVCLAAEYAPLLAAAGTAQDGIGATIAFADTVDSTQKMPAAVWGVAGAPHGSVAVARHQTEGRGRSSNTWTSPEGCLMFTTALRAPAAWGAHVALFQHAMAIAVVEGVQAAIAATGAKPAQLHIKWPNDIYATPPAASEGSGAPVKVGGILVQSEFDSAASAFLLKVGCGLNVYDTPPYAALNDWVDPPLRKAALLAHIMLALQDVWQAFEAGEAAGDPFQALLPRYHALWLHSDMRVTAGDAPVATPAEGTAGTAMSTGTEVRIFSLCPTSGALLASEDLDGSGPGAGPVWSLHPDGNSLDMMAGLIKRKA